MILRETNRSSRDLLVGCAAVIAGVAFLVLAAAILLKLLNDSHLGFVPTAYSVGRGFDLAHDVVLSGALGVACGAFLSSIEVRERRLALAAGVAASAFTVSVVAQALYAEVDIAHHVGFAHHLPVELVASDLLSVGGAALFAAAAATATVAFHKARFTRATDQSGRDGRLGWAAIGLGAGSALATASGALYANAVGLFGVGDTGLWFGVAGYAVIVLVGAIAAGALLTSRRGQRRADRRWMSRREIQLAAGFGVLVVGVALQGIGSAVLANALSKEAFGPSSDITTSYWLAATSSWVLCLGAACAAIGFVRSRTTVAALELT